MNLDPSSFPHKRSLLAIQVPSQRPIKVFKQNEMIGYTLLFLASLLYFDIKAELAVLINLAMLVGKVTQAYLRRETGIVKRIAQRAHLIPCWSEKREDHPALSPRINDCYHFLYYAQWKEVALGNLGSSRFLWLQDVTQFLKHYPQHPFYLKTSRKLWDIVLKNFSTIDIARIGALCQGMPALEPPMVLSFEDQNLQLPFYYRHILKQDFEFFAKYFSYLSPHSSESPCSFLILQTPLGFAELSTVFKDYLQYRYEKHGPFQLEFILLERYLCGQDWANDQFRWILCEIDNLAEVIHIAQSPWPFSEESKQALGRRLVHHVQVDDLQGFLPSEIMSVFSELKLSRFSFTSYSSKREIEIVFPYLSALTKLELSVLKSLKAIAGMGIRMPGLTELHLSLGDPFSHDPEQVHGLGDFLSNCTKLQSLKLNFCGCRTAYSLSHLGTLPLLTKLEFSFYRHARNGAFEHLLPKVPQLRTLNLGYSTIGNRFFEELPLHCTQLHTLHLRSMEQVSDEALDGLRLNCPNLTQLFVI